MQVFNRSRDVVCTLIVWVYFTLGYLAFFSPIHLFLFFFSPSREQAFQRTNSIFYKGFFKLLQGLSPTIEIDVRDTVYAVRGAVVVSNHISYLDPILLISLFPRHKTIVKALFFKVPIFGWVLKHSGYLPASGRPQVISSLWLDQMEGLADHFSSGGNLFIFPEGTRRRDGRMGRFQEGAFRIARRHRVPIQVLHIKGTNAIFPPDRFVFHIRPSNPISVRRLGEVTPEQWDKGASISEVMDRVRALYETADE